MIFFSFANRNIGIEYLSTTIFIFTLPNGIADAATYLTKDN